MLIRFLQKIWSMAEATGAKCPKCGDTNTDKQNGIWHCYECGHEW